MNKYYFTFGEGQLNHGKYVVIESDFLWNATAIMFSRFGSSWSWSYNQEEWFEDGVSQAEKYNYEELKI